VSCVWYFDIARTRTWCAVPLLCSIACTLERLGQAPILSLYITSMAIELLFMRRHARVPPDLEPPKY
jgi:hypothetical protein